MYSFIFLSLLPECYHKSFSLLLRTSLNVTFAVLVLAAVFPKPFFIHQVKPEIMLLYNLGKSEILFVNINEIFHRTLRDKGHFQLKERLLVIKFQEKKAFTYTLPFTDKHLHFFLWFSFSDGFFRTLSAITGCPRRY